MLTRQAWSPYLAGVVIGLLQVPAFLLIETALGAYLSVSTPVDAAVMAESVRQHTRIADAIEAGDAGKAAQSMLDVIDIGLSRIVEERI